MFDPWRCRQPFEGFPALVGSPCVRARRKPLLDVVADLLEGKSHDLDRGLGIEPGEDRANGVGIALAGLVVIRDQHDVLARQRRPVGLLGTLIAMAGRRDDDPEHADQVRALLAFDHVDLTGLSQFVEMVKGKSGFRRIADTPAVAGNRGMHGDESLLILRQLDPIDPHHLVAIPVKVDPRPHVRDPAVFLLGEPLRGILGVGQFLPLRGGLGLDLAEPLSDGRNRSFISRPMALTIASAEQVLPLSSA